MEKTLLILAAGMGSRFGGLKQITPLGPNDEFIIDYSVYDAKKAGFTKIVFLIKEENLELFKETIGKRVEPHINVEYCFQKNDNIPSTYQIPSERVKPFGTAHAILCCKDKIHEPFAMINSDDFYGFESYDIASKYLDNIKDTPPYQYGLIGYKVKNTVTDNGAVKRGVCEANDGKLTSLIESSVEKNGDKFLATPLDGSTPFTITSDSLVSMNFLLFTPSIFERLEKDLVDFFEKNKNDLTKCEFLIPDVLFKAMKEGYATVDLLETPASWYGVTYKEDAPFVKESLKKLTEDGVYPEKRWK